ncbi:MAG: class I SAM-dependent methyltransferase [Myxococcales bacterium]|nr:class I SAM-dependent methyltransferase [Myxococcales bacterium]
MNFEAFQALSAAAGLTPLDGPSAHARLAQYFDVRAQWARVHNLSGPATLKDPWANDALDALAVRQCLIPQVPLVDVGTGNGVPGLLVACLDPERPVVLVEPRVKRVAFLRSTAGAIGLHKVQLHRARWPVSIPAPFQIVSRAVVSPAEWPTLALAGARPMAVLRMLAEDRPPLTLPGWQQQQAVDYPSLGRSLRVERWEPTTA